MRKLFLALLALLVWAMPAWAQITLVSGQTASSTSGTMWVGGSLDQTLSFPGAVTSGNTVVAWTGWTLPSRTMSCTHDGNAMTAITTVGGTGGSYQSAFQVFAIVATTTGTDVTCTMSGTDPNEVQSFAIAEFTGTAAVLSTQGVTGVNTTTAAETTAATSHDSGADLTPDTTHNLSVMGAVCTGNGGTWGNDGATMIISGAFWRTGYLIQSSTTALDWVPTTTNSVDCEIAHQNLDGATAGATCTGGLTLLGAGKCD
jgi:hypothetical protein